VVDERCWLVVHLVAVAALAGIGWVVQCVVYPAFALVGQPEWAAYHARHTRAITFVVGLPWAGQGISTAALLLRPGHLVVHLVHLVLAALALVTVVSTIAVAVPAHNRLAALDPGIDSSRTLAVLLRANLVRTLAWTASAGMVAALLLARA
jgi:hypothetical protein